MLHPFFIFGCALTKGNYSFLSDDMQQGAGWSWKCIFTETMQSLLSSLGSLAAHLLSPLQFLICIFV